MVFTIPQFVVLAENKDTGRPRLMGFGDTSAQAQEMQERAVRAGELSVTIYRQFDPGEPGKK